MSHPDNHEHPQAADHDDGAVVPGPVAITGPGDLITAVPYLLGFHPHDSLVLIGLAGRRLVVTARLDLPADNQFHPEDRATRGQWTHQLERTIHSIQVAGVDRIVAVLYPDPAALDSAPPSLPYAALSDHVRELVTAAGVAMGDRQLVARGRWWSYDCTDSGCFATDGTLLPEAVSAFQAAATVAGTTVAPSRDCLTDLFTPDPDRGHLRPLLAAAERAELDAVIDNHHRPFQRAVIRALFATARASTQPDWSSPGAEAAARFGAALRTGAVRDAVWLAVDAGRLDGSPLWLDLARRLPTPTGRHRRSCPADTPGATATAHWPASPPTTRSRPIPPTAPRCCWPRHSSVASTPAASRPSPALPDRHRAPRSASPIRSRSSDRRPTATRSTTAPANHSPRTDPVTGASSCPGPMPRHNHEGDPACPAKHSTTSTATP